MFLALFLQQKLNITSLLDKIVGASGGSDLLRASNGIGAAESDLRQRF